MQGWAVEEVGGAAFGDARLTKRLIKIVEDLAGAPTASVPEASGDWAATKAVYRFWDNEQVQPEAIRAPHQAQTVARMSAHAVVLVAQDTTELNYTAHRAVKGVGPLRATCSRGLHVHSGLALTTTGVPLGLLHQEVWARDPATVGVAKRRRTRAFEDKESRRWVSTLSVLERLLPPEQHVVVVADREADMYELFAAPRRAGHDLLIRMSHNHRIQEEPSYVWPAIRQAPELGRLRVQIPRGDEGAPREAELTIRASAVHLAPPRHAPKRASRPWVPLQLVLAEERTPPAGREAICWLLATTLPVTSFDEAVQLVRWYTFRWLIERYHFVLKSGCRIEELQLETAERLERALATYSIVAWRLLWLTYLARQEPTLPADTVLEAHEWQALLATTAPATDSNTPPPLGLAVFWIARLGGFLGRTHDGYPGVKTIWRGLRRLHDIAHTWRLAHPQLYPSHPIVGNA